MRGYPRGRIADKSSLYHRSGRKAYPIFVDCDNSRLIPLKQARCLVNTVTAEVDLGARNLTGFATYQALESRIDLPGLRNGLASKATERVSYIAMALHGCKNLMNESAHSCHSLGTSITVETSPMRVWARCDAARFLDCSDQPSWASYQHFLYCEMGG